MPFTLYASNIPSFQVFLERNPITKQILGASDLQGVAKILAEYAKDKSVVPIAREDGIATFISGIYTGENAFAFDKNVKKFSIFNALFDEVSIALIQRHIYNTPTRSDPKEADMGGSAIDLESVIADYEGIFKEEQLKRLIRSPILLKGPIILYNYVDKKTPLAPDEAGIFLLRVEEELKKIPGETLDCLLLTGGHGSKDFLNNLSPKARDAMVCLFRKYNVSVNTIAIDCCFGARHLMELAPLLSKEGVIVANYIESNAHSIFQAFQPSSQTTFLRSMRDSLAYNCGIVVYQQSAERVLALKSSLQPDDSDTPYAAAKRAEFKAYLKSQRLPLELVSTPDLLDAFRTAFPPGGSASAEGYEAKGSCKKGSALAEARRQLLFPPPGTEQPLLTTPTSQQVLLIPK